MNWLTRHIAFYVNTSGLMQQKAALESKQRFTTMDSIRLDLTHYQIQELFQEEKETLSMWQRAKGKEGRN